MADADKMCLHGIVAVSGHCGIAASHTPGVVEAAAALVCVPHQNYRRTSAALVLERQRSQVAQKLQQHKQLSYCSSKSLQSLWLLLTSAVKP